MDRQTTHPLDDYNARRDFRRTAEPAGDAAPGGGDGFVVQKHAARRLHYDFRLELDGVLKSWAVPEGPSLVAGLKRLAVRTEDHPVGYRDFEGTIPEGEYGAGTVMVWDHGRWEPEGDPGKGLKKGHLTFRLEGGKLTGRWHLVRMRAKRGERQESWLLIKAEDDAARGEGDADVLAKDRSALSGRTMTAIAAGRQAPSRPRSKGRATPAKFMAPMLATLAEEAPEGPGWVHELKFDGYRLQAHVADGRARLLTRSGLDWTDRFPLLAEALAALPVRDAVLDGEAVVETASGHSDFAALQDALATRDPARVRLMLFDLLRLDGRDRRRAPLVERKAALEALLKDQPADGRLAYSEHLEEDAACMVRHACRLGVEGIIAKRADAPYRGGRGRDWLKVKCTDRQEFVVLGYQPSTTRAKAVASLLMGVNGADGLVPVGKVNTGFNARDAAALRRRLEPLETAKPKGMRGPAGVRWLRPELVAEVEFRGWTGDGMIRHGVFKGMREDKEAGDVVAERAIPAAAGDDGAEGRDGTVAGITLSHPDRVLWEGQGVTKLGLAEFYAGIADWVLPHLVDRPLSLVRCPGGSGKPCFFAKHALSGLDDAVRRVDVSEPGDAGAEGDRYMMVHDLRGLVALVQMGVLELHPWGATAADLERPDRLVMDLDPGPGLDWEAVVEGALLVRDRLADQGLASFVKTTGGKGLHVVVPLTPRDGWDRVKGFAHDLAKAIAADQPDRYTATLSKKARQGRIFIDYLRNGRGATAVAAYSTRAREGAPVATPLAWDELEAGVTPSALTVATLPRRLARLGRDPWADLATTRQTLPRATTARPRKSKSA